MSSKIYLGVDPGVSGAIAAILPSGEVVTIRNDTGDYQIFRWLQEVKENSGCKGDAYAVIEQQTPRPTFIPARGEIPARNTVLASTCILYGSYLRLSAILNCCPIPTFHCPPTRWQEALGLPDKEKGETDSKWKGRLKQEAKRLFPGLTITLKESDALLLAAYCAITYGDINAAATTEES